MKHYDKIRKLFDQNNGLLRTAQLLEQGIPNFYLTVLMMDEGKIIRHKRGVYCQEEFLRRMNQSNYKDNFILKGGLFLYCLNEFQGRPTMDIDFLMRCLSNNLENIQEVIQEIIMVPSQNDFIQYTLLGTEVITEHREYHGIRVKLMAKVKNTLTK